MRRTTTHIVCVSVRKEYLTVNSIICLPLPFDTYMDVYMSVSLRHGGQHLCLFPDFMKL